MQPNINRRKRFLLSNIILVANFIAVWGASEFAQFLSEDWSRHSLDMLEPEWELDQLIDWTYVLVICGAIFWYEQPIRKVLKLMAGAEPVDAALLMVARKRVLNEPYFIIGMDFCSWISVGIIYMVCYFSTGDGPTFFILNGIYTVLTALIAVAIAFFSLQFIMQRWLIPIFFPLGKLTSIPGTQQTRINKILLGLSLAINVIPLLLIIFANIKFSLADIDVMEHESMVEAFGEHMILAAFIFLFFGAFLTVLVSRNLRRPLQEITQTLQKITVGHLHHRVSVTTNDEIGYTGDVINEMTEGLRERARLQKSIDIAQEVQQLLLPDKAPEIFGLDIAGRSIYCEETGGDYFDYLPPLAGSSTARFLVGDVCGHGVGSALFMSTARALLRFRSQQEGSLLDIVTDVNRELYSDFGDYGQFMTLFYLSVDPEEGTLKWIRAGHDPAIVYHPATDSFSELFGTGVPLGIDEDWVFEENHRAASPDGEIILIGTDGIWETQNSEKEMFGKEAVYDIIRVHSHESAEQITEAIVTEVAAFNGETEQEDDLTLIVIKT